MAEGFPSLTLLSEIDTKSSSIFGFFASPACDILCFSARAKLRRAFAGVFRVEDRKELCDVTKDAVSSPTSTPESTSSSGR